mmetsp:Transcript_3700/g.11540  ORF Transcript_3700/g.11540 Transcript_3700/m.11540 type:complete len:259 (-) Transcript_3700:434-1210(-)
MGGCQATAARPQRGAKPGSATRRPVVVTTIYWPAELSLSPSAMPSAAGPSDPACASTRAPTDSAVAAGFSALSAPTSTFSTLSNTTTCSFSCSLSVRQSLSMASARRSAFSARAMSFLCLFDVSCSAVVASLICFEYDSCDLRSWRIVSSFSVFFLVTAAMEECTFSIVAFTLASLLSRVAISSRSFSLTASAASARAWNCSTSLSAWPTSLACFSLSFCVRWASSSSFFSTSPLRSFSRLFSASFSSTAAKTALVRS